MRRRHGDVDARVGALGGCGAGGEEEGDDAQRGQFSGLRTHAMRVAESAQNARPRSRARRIGAMSEQPTPQRTAQETRAALLEAAAAEILECGYAAASLSAIAARHGLTKGALAHQFPTKSAFVSALGDALREAVRASVAAGRKAYPDSPSHALIAFVLHLGSRATSDPAVAAATALFSDRAVPDPRLAGAVGELLEETERFVAEAYAAGEGDSSLPPADVAEHIVVTNLGTASFRLHQHPTGPGRPRLRFLRITLAGAGFHDVDSVIDEVVSSRANGTLDALPPSRSMTR
ncbi:TetR/AcrR family transcriptional regulator [Georgenia wutianyii]|uniref:TetR/AcrR family transcriptional regulator n=2 Tax=Bogoriellaceae TaxID=145358 RepID=A0ABX5VSL1_9MICO|nr:TetR/AcrR family transcriptional regulator [Georgenia wutianyii]